MTRGNSHSAPERCSREGALVVFIGDWKAEGISFGDNQQSRDNPRAGRSPWLSVHSALWHSGEFFVIQDERASGPFNTLSVMGVDDKTGQYFASSFENHGFHRHYDVSFEGNTWTFSGDSERARYIFSEDGQRQTITWEWKPNDEWLPLCDRVAVKVA